MKYLQHNNGHNSDKYILLDNILHDRLHIRLHGKSQRRLSWCNNIQLMDTLHSPLREILIVKVYWNLKPAFMRSSAFITIRQ